MSQNNYPSKKARKVIIRTSVLVFDYIKRNPNSDDIDALNFVRKKYDYSHIEVGDSVELFAIQEGAVYIVYQYIKDNPEKTKQEVAKEIALNYSNLLNEYCREE